MFQKMNILSKPSLKLLCFLGRRYREEYHTREIVRKLDISLGSASRSLNILENEELVNKEEKGKLSRYKANMENPILRELKILFTLMEIEELIKDLKLMSNQIILYGSCATGEDTQDSDIDLFIKSNNSKKVNKSINNHQKHIERTVSLVVFDDMELRTLKEKDMPFYSRIKKGRLLYEVSV
ncbi:MAG: nucleotidyltransferase domain-containing protein [Methanobacterium sp. ERen5]|nr:MAG: nucleotidyltransferase domain-containing protein [Methanobacterium sp. ERen5]